MQPLKLNAYRVAKELKGGWQPPRSTRSCGGGGRSRSDGMRLSRYFSPTAQLLADLQTQYDLEIASRRIGTQVKRRIRPPGAAGSGCPE